MPTEEEDLNERAALEWYERKSAWMAQILGEEHDIVMHTLIPYDLGGGLDEYCYPHGIPGTAIATKELAPMPQEGSSNKVFRCYELVMFTRQPLSLENALDEATSFGKVRRVMSAILNDIARYSAMAKLNPRETCEFPEEMNIVGGRCLIFDGYPNPPDGEVADFGLLAVIEIFRSEMEYAMKQGGHKLIALLKENGVYPYSDLDREAVI